MNLLHATWLPAGRTQAKSACPALFLWAETWRATEPIRPGDNPALHPFTLCEKDLKEWLNKKDLLPKDAFNVSACLTLPSRAMKLKKTRTLQKNKDFPEEKSNNRINWAGLPLQAGEPVPKQYECWPWQIEGIALEPYQTSEWLSLLPLSGKNPELGEELQWWSHFQRWSLSLIARGLWLPQIEFSKVEDSPHRARWIPLLVSENDRRKLEDFSSRLPLVGICALQWRELSRSKLNSKKSLVEESSREETPIASCRIQSGRLIVANLLQEIVDAQLRQEFKPSKIPINNLLKEWEKALSSKTGVINLKEEEIKRLAKASKTWKEGIAGNVAPARACLELFSPKKNEELWELNFSLQAEADPNLKVPAKKAWLAGNKSLQIGEIRIEKPAEVLLEGLGRAITIFEPLVRGLDTATPTSMLLTPAEAFVFVRTSTAALRKIGIGVILPTSLSGGLSSRLGLKIKAELSNISKGFSLGEELVWNWELMIGGLSLTLKDLEKLASKQSPLLQYKGSWIELRTSDLKNAQKFCQQVDNINLDDAIRITGTKGESLMRLPVHSFEAGPRLQNVLDKYHQQKSPDPLPAPEGFDGQLRPYQERGIGWLAFLHRFNQGACLADDMGLGKTIQLLAFIQYLKSEQELKRPILLITPTSVLTNWKREVLSFTPHLKIYEHYGAKRETSKSIFASKLKKVNIVITSYGLIQRDIELLNSIDWQGVVIDEAQAIKNPKGKQSKAVRQIASEKTSNRFRIALTGTPIENRISEIWALMNFLNPKILGEEEFFHQRYKLPIEQYGDISSQKDLKSRISPFILRRLKTDRSIISDLPEKVEINEWVGLSKEQKTLYNQTVETMLNDISTSQKGSRHGKILSLLLRLKQICNHPALFLKEETINESFLQRSLKLERLEEILNELIEGGDRALLFTQFSQWGHLLQRYLEERWKSEVPFLHGGSTKTNRQKMIDRFQEDPRGPQLFILSLKAGGVGLNLTRASHVFHIDRWWNPAVENQATDRAYRIGQVNRVIVHKFITSGSIEEKIDLMIKKKSQLAEEIIGSGEDWLGEIDVDELKDLVALKEEV